MTENTKSFRTSADHERTRRAAEIAATKRASVDAASAAVAAAEEACVAEPTDKAFSKAKEARRVLDDAERDLALAEAHSARVEAEVADTERARIREEVARRERDLTTVVDGEARLMAVEAAALAVRMQRHTMKRIDQRRADLEELNDLLARVGQPKQEVPNVEPLADEAVKELCELGLSALAQLGIRVAGKGGPQVDTRLPFFPYWQESGASGGPKEFYSGNARPTVSGTMPDGTPITSGRDATHIVAAAAELLERVEAKRVAEKGAKSSTSGIATKAAAVGAMALGAALTLVQG